VHKKLWASKVEGVSILGILGLSTWESQEKCHLGVVPMVNLKEYYKGEGGGFPQIQVMVNFMNSCMAMIRPCTKNVPIMH